MKARLLLFTAFFFPAWPLQAEEEIFAAADLEVLAERAGLETIVEGVVQETGKTQEGGITFLNLDGPKKRGFTVVIFQRDYPSFTLDFAGLTGKKIRVRGPIELYGDRPQIVLRQPGQLEILEESAGTP